jgi:hypothetical protein
MTHLPNELALKMDGAQACHRCPTVAAGWRPGRVGGRGGCVAAWAVRPGETAPSADLGGSSKYSNGNFED